MAPINGMAWTRAARHKDIFDYWMDEAREDILGFVRARLKWEQPAAFVTWHKGSFNVCAEVQRGDSDEHVLIRFAAPGIYGPWREEKVASEAAVLRYLHDHTSVPVPRVLDSGTESESPRQLGPFLILERMTGVTLTDVLSIPGQGDPENPFLDPNIDNTRLDYVYEQLAGYLLEMSRLEFPSIGALAGTSSDRTMVIQRPLTYDMNEVVTLGDMSADFFATAPFDRARAYFAARAQSMLVHLGAQRNIARGDDNGAWRLWQARRGLARLAARYTVDSSNAGPFRLFCDDMRPANMLVDPETFRITAILDWEFTNAMPAQYAYDVPWWLLLQGAAFIVAEQGKEAFLRQFVPRKDQFLQAMERVEAKLPVAAADGTALSVRMRESWDSGRFWFNVAMRNSFELDYVYWDFLHTEEVGAAVEAEVTMEGKLRFLRRKRVQFAVYEAEKIMRW